MQYSQPVLAGDLNVIWKKYMKEIIGATIVILFICMFVVWIIYVCIDGATDILDYKIVTNKKIYKIKELAKFLFFIRWRDFGRRWQTEGGNHLEVIYFSTLEEAEEQLITLKADLLRKQKEKEAEEKKYKLDKSKDWEDTERNT